MLDVLDGRPQGLNLAHPLAGGLGGGQPGPQLGEYLVAVLHPRPLPLTGRPPVLLSLARVLEPLGSRPPVTRPACVISLKKNLLVVCLVIVERLRVEIVDWLILREPDWLVLTAGHGVVVVLVSGLAVGEQLQVTVVGLLALHQHVHHLVVTGKS